MHVNVARLWTSRGTRASNRVACTLLTTAALFGSGTCAAEGWYVAVGGGLRDIEVDRNSSVANSFSNDDNAVAELGGGYVFSSNLVLEGSITDAVSVAGFLGFGSYEFDDDRLMVGYAFPVGENFRIVPAIGASFWDFRATSNVFFGSSSAEREQSGTDLVWRLGGEFMFGETFGICFGYTRAEFDVGDTSLASVGARIEF